MALALGTEPQALAPLEDSFELAAHASALHAAGVSAAADHGRASETDER